MKTIYTHDEAAAIVELFEDVLDRCNVVIPSPEDYERRDDNEAKLYGTIYYDLLADVEDAIIGLLERHVGSVEIVIDEFSGGE